MFAYAKNMQLAASDKLRRVGLTVGAGVVLTIGAGFLLAALWSYLTYNLGWGSMMASLVIGAVLVVLGLIVLGIARVERHPAPSTDDLRVEVEQQLHLMANSAITKVSDAADAAMDRASVKAGQVLDQAEHKVHAVADNLGYRANRAADLAEARVYGAARNMSETAARRFGFASSETDEPSRMSSVAPFLGALAVGITLASRLQSRRHRDDD
ncbi:phage holin family protein [Paracoccus aestuariivivens]|uniref:Phage holin family protein n=1 Tax=Paracoccus aestuariivivens TaxID=1820333 RepID=A0A6L6JF02_9RHOB|nr:phage holin family protein [Paracoccus aestuariivivens]MTH79319.1 phage holin family protein [Paracoccus aestuariivivens]